MTSASTPQPDFPIDQVRAYYADRLSGPGKRYRMAFAETLTDWRLGRASQPADFSATGDILRAGVAEIIALRLEQAYNPLFHGLQKIENKFAILASVRDDPYAPPPKRGQLIQTRF